MKTRIYVDPDRRRIDKELNKLKKHFCDHLPDDQRVDFVVDNFDHAEVNILLLVAIEKLVMADKKRKQQRADYEWLFKKYGWSTDRVRSLDPIKESDLLKIER